MSKVVGLGVIGCGWAASEIARVAEHLPQLSIAAATDSDPARAAALVAQTGARHAISIHDLLSDPAVTTVYVGVPHHLLAPIAERALNAGKHVLVEKPLALSATEALRLGALAESQGLKLCVFFELRHSGSVQVARRLLSEGAVGKPCLVRIKTVIDKKLSYWGPPEARNWRASKQQAGGGVLLMNSIHQLDTLRYITGLEFTRASGEIATFTAPADVEDAASATLRLSNGGIVNIVAAAHSFGARDEETIEIDGDAGRLDLPYAFGTRPVRLYRDGSWSDFRAPPLDSHAEMLAAFLSAVIGDGDVPAGARDAAAAIAAVNAIYQASSERRSVEIRST